MFNMNYYYKHTRDLRMRKKKSFWADYRRVWQRTTAGVVFFTNFDKLKTEMYGS